jgi:hypothetical protein
VLSQAEAGRERAGTLLDAGLAEARRLGMPLLVETAERVRAEALVSR